MSQELSLSTKTGISPENHLLWSRSLNKQANKQFSGPDLDTSSYGNKGESFLSLLRDSEDLEPTTGTMEDHGFFLLPALISTQTIVHPQSTQMPGSRPLGINGVSAIKAPLHLAQLKATGTRYPGGHAGVCPTPATLQPAYTVPGAADGMEQRVCTILMKCELSRTERKGPRQPLSPEW